MNFKTLRYVFSFFTSTSFYSFYFFPQFYQFARKRSGLLCAKTKAAISLLNVADVTARPVYQSRYWSARSVAPEAWLLRAKGIVNVMKDAESAGAEDAGRRETKKHASYDLSD